MPNRITGMYSGMDTESLIRDLMKAKRKKSDTLTKDKTKLEWKQEKWTDLNKKIKSFYSKTVSNFRWASTFTKKASTVSNPAAASVITGENAMSSVQNLSIKSLASSGYLTGAKVEAADGSDVKAGTMLSELSFDGKAFSGSGSFDVTVGGKSTTISVDSDTTMEGVVWQLNRAGVSANFDAKNGRLFIGATDSGKDKDFTITANDAVGDKALSTLGINVDAGEAVKKQYEKLASYGSYFTGATASDWVDAIQGAGVSSDIYKTVTAMAKDNYSKEISAKEAELSSLSAEDEPDEEAIDALKAEIETMKSNMDAGVYSTTAMEDAAKAMKEKVHYASNVDLSDTSRYNTDAVKLKGADAEIELNGVSFSSSSNSVEVNGLTITCKEVADNITITTQNDIDGIYDVVKKFVKEYNDLIKEIDGLYNAEATKLQPLNDEEKDAVTESEAKKIEDKVRESLLRHDTTLGTIFSDLRSFMADGITVNGETHYLSEFGIETASYLNAADGEKYLLHIAGDEDDEVSGGTADKLKSLIASDSEFVVSFFSQLGKDLYAKLGDLSKGDDDRTYGSFYNDKLLKKDISSYTSKIADAEEKLTKEEDKLYKKFAAMEVALSKMDSNSSYLSGLFTK